MTHRLDLIRTLLPPRGAALLTFLPDIRWACGFTGTAGVLLVLPDDAHFITDGRYREQARGEVEGARIHIPQNELLSFVAEAGLLGAQQKVLIQADHLTLTDLHRLTGLFPTCEWVPAEKLLQRFVAVKEAPELAAMQRAQAITDAVFLELLDVLRPGLTEREVAAEIVYRHLRRGAEKMSFDPVVASGPQGALPHARPGDRVLTTGDMVVLDFGCFVDGYASDMTRTVAVGEPGATARKVYELVRTAQQRALEVARAGMTTCALDAEARAVIDAGGYGPQFMHGLGHGVGLQIHEWPSVSFRTRDVLPAGAVVTIEPGIYLPGAFGVRIEDLVVLRHGGCENLTGSPHKLIVL